MFALNALPSVTLVWIIIIAKAKQTHMLYENSNFFNFREEREAYYGHRQKPKNNPRRYACLIIDGMDQMKLLIPQLLNIMKAYSSAWKLKTHLTGRIVKFIKLFSSSKFIKLILNFMFLFWSHLTINMTILFKISQIECTQLAGYILEIHACSNPSPLTN